jgi:DNA-binding Lrp family transcriptional regulator
LAGAGARGEGIIETTSNVAVPAMMTRPMPNMKSVDTVTGPFDIIAVVEAQDLPSIGNLISEGMHRVPGIVKTVTCLAVGS